MTTTTTTPTTPLTNAELEWMERRTMPDYDRHGAMELMRRAAAEIRALRAERDDLLAALYHALVTLGRRGANASLSHPDRALWEYFRAAIDRAEGRAEG